MYRKIRVAFCGKFIGHGPPTYGEADQQGQLYAVPSKLAAIGLTVLVSSVKCERDFSTLSWVILIRVIIN